MPRRSTKHANRILDRMFAAAVKPDQEAFDEADHDLLSEYFDGAKPDEALDAMPRPILARWCAVVRLLGERT